MIRSQEIQLKAILARFKGNHRQAWLYCLAMSLAYPQLAEEYGGYSWKEDV